MRRVAVVAWLMILLTGIVALFWRNEWIYNLPTPVPANYKAVHTGERITIAGLAPAANNTQPLFLHFFNPNCPCSKFNVPHFKELVSQYGRNVRFAIVVMSDQTYSTKDIQNKFGLDIPVLFDTTIAAQCGVYSTPQAVIINDRDELYYRGNYNKSRYCTDKKTNYAQTALDNLLQQKRQMVYEQLALKAYGCQLPACKQAATQTNY